MSDVSRDSILDDGDEPDPDPPDPDPPEPIDDDDPIEPDPDEPDPDEPDPDEPDPDEPPRQTRRSGPRGRPNGEEIRELRRENEEIRRQMRALQQQPRQPAVDPQAQARADQEFWASLDLMTPAEAHRAVYNRATREVSQAFYQQNSQTQDRTDKQAYATLASTSPIHQRYQQRVEEAVANERARGNIVDREVMFAWLEYQDRKTRAARIAPQQRRRGAANVARQTVRPGNGRGDVQRSGGRRSQDSDDEALLRQTRVSDI